MTTEEKLQHFLETCMEDARTRSNKMLDEYSAALFKTFHEHQSDAKRRAHMQLEQETEKMERDMNKSLSIEQLNLKRHLGHILDDRKDSIFIELKDKLDLFMHTSDYLTLLEQQIEQAIAFAGDDELTIWIDPMDENKMNQLIMKYGTSQLKISEYSFGGGIRAVIPSRHILIDNSFQKKLDNARESFHFDMSMIKPGGIIHD